VVREAEGSVPKRRLDVVWHDETQRERCLGSLVADGLVVATSPSTYALPT
jgi:A/G-specific adenine glycosylase